MGMREIDRDSGMFGQGFMSAHLAALVKGHGEAHLFLKAFEDPAKGPRYRGGLPILQPHQDAKESFALDQNTDLRQVALANDEVSFPVARHQSFAHRGRSLVDQGHVRNGSTPAVFAACRSAGLVFAAQQVQQAGAELSPRHSIQCAIDSLMGKTDRISHTSQCARDLHRTQAPVKMLQHGDPERVAGYQLALAARFTSQHTSSSIGHHTAVASSDGTLAQLSSPSVASNLTANRRPGSLQPGSNPCRAHPQRQLRLNNNSLLQIKMAKTSWHMQLSPLSEMLHLYPESAVPHISLVFREMWDTTALSLGLSIHPMPSLSEGCP